jgi:hypothetical protein
MTCSRCAKDDTRYPKTTEWGPLIWKILHTLAEKAGRQSNTILQADEMRAWILFVKHLPTVLPCEDCRGHAKIYIAEHPFEPPESYPAWNLYVRMYLYTFHEAVNTRLEKPSFPFSSLASTYKATGELNTWITALNEMTLRAMKLNGMHLKPWENWINQLRMLKAAMCI